MAIEPETWPGFLTREERVLDSYMNKNVLNLRSLQTDLTTAEADIDTLEALHNRPYVYATHSATNQSIANAGSVKWFNTFNTVASGAGAVATLTSGRLRLTSSLTPGIWYAVAQTYWSSNSNGYRSIYIAKNQTIQTGLNGGVYQSTVSAANGGVRIHQVSGFFSLAVNDYLDIGLYQNSGAALNITASTQRLTAITAFKLFD